MREPVRDKGRLEHILHSIDNIARFTKDYTLDSFVKEDLVYYAVVKNIEIIGEAAYMITKEFQIAHPEIDWQVIIKMRHVLVHGYYQLEKDEIWNAATIDVPSLRPQIEKYIIELESLRTN